MVWSAKHADQTMSTSRVEEADRFDTLTLFSELQK